MVTVLVIRFSAFGAKRPTVQRQRCCSDAKSRPVCSRAHSRNRSRSHRRICSRIRSAVNSIITVILPGVPFTDDDEEDSEMLNNHRIPLFGDNNKEKTMTTN